jgi:hypothetical protein
VWHRFEWVRGSGGREMARLGGTRPSCAAAAQSKEGEREEARAWWSWWASWPIGPAHLKGGSDGLWAGELEKEMKNQSEIDF